MLSALTHYQSALHDLQRAVEVQDWQAVQELLQQSQTIRSEFVTGSPAS
jgi:prephenate dehydrogenase